MAAIESPETGSPPLPCLNLYVVWAPQLKETNGKIVDKSEGATLAEDIYTHFCFDLKNPFYGGLGIPVYFRSVGPANSIDAPPPPINLDTAECSIVIALVDSEMTLNQTFWKDYFDALMKVKRSSDRHLIIPVALSKGAYNFAPLSPDNFIRYFEFPPEQRWLKFQLKLASRIALHFRSQRDSDTIPADSPHRFVSKASARIFLSHAKVDGLEETKLLKEDLDNLGMDRFFDSVDIPPGNGVKAEIIKRITDAVVVVMLSDNYSDRPWCQMELLTAKQMQRPLVVVDDIKGKVYRSFPYLGNVPTIRKTPGDEAAILALAVDEALRGMVLSRRMAQLLERQPHLRSARYLLRSPEALDGYHIAGLSLETPAGGETPEHEKAGPITILYPDPPLGIDELDAIDRTLLSQYRFATPLHLRGPERLKHLTVGISISESPDFAELGFAKNHLDEIMVELARHLLAGGARLAYGGDLRDEGFTKALIDIVATYNASQVVDFKAIENFQAWPYYLNTDRKREEELLPFAHIHRIPSQNEVAAEFPAFVDGKIPDPVPSELPLARALSLTRMREAMNSSTNARLLLGGRTQGWQGVLPGVLEEACLALRDGKPLFLLGGFGGCTKAIIDLLCGQDSEAIQSALQERPAELVTAYRVKMPEAKFLDYEEIKSFLANQGISGLKNGLSEEENKRLFQAIDTEEILSLLLRGLRQTSN